MKRAYERERDEAFEAHVCAKRTGTATIRIQTAFELNERPEVLAVMSIEIEHVPFIEIAIHEGLLAPVVVSDLLPNLASFAADSTGTSRSDRIADGCI
jgi:hypothetical protein